PAGEAASPAAFGPRRRLRGLVRRRPGRARRSLHDGDPLNEDRARRSNRLGRFHMLRTEERALMSKQMNDADYRKLFEFRARLLRFLRAADQRIRDAGLTPTHYLLLLGTRAAASSRGPTIGDMADFL